MESINKNIDTTIKKAHIIGEKINENKVLLKKFSVY